MRIGSKTIDKYITIMDVIFVSAIQSRGLDTIAIHVAISIYVIRAMNERVTTMSCKRFS